MYKEFNRRIHDVIKDKIFPAQQMNSVTKNGERVNLEDYYTDNGAFDDDGMDRFIAALERLMTIDEFTKFLKMWNKLNK